MAVVGDWGTVKVSTSNGEDDHGIRSSGVIREIGAEGNGKVIDNEILFADDVVIKVEQHKVLVGSDNEVS